ncbi:MAG TPA: hypothetical protein VMR77_00785 [Patescibacteria group bacterium]|jgi:hypothetical protein|nr:hypothetical protein [Patescibacteria group bacterium]
MSDSINLVSPKNEQLEKEQNRLRIARVVAFSVMFLVAAVAVLVFVVNLTLPINSIKRSEEVTLSNIAALHKKFVQYYFVQDRINHLTNVIEKRNKVSDVVDAFLAITPDDLSIGSMQIDVKKFSLIMSGGSLVSMNKFIDDVTILSQKKNIIQNVVVQQLSLDVKNNKYSISIQADIK